ncbi:hypothetical protein CCR75_007470 [Bremia lactucae]|uniref:Uncharacterized protein n=1 Tax=Bremia lactucae TaxID=4779 RepID=A0A976IEV5_BRELC|nr:hypothetical protein CCR75_007470 [Bremia lactucae]
MHLKYFVAILAVNLRAVSALDLIEQGLIDPSRRWPEPFRSFPANQLVDESHGALRTSRDLAQDDDNETRMISLTSMRAPITKSVANAQKGPMRNAVFDIVAERISQLEHSLANKDTVVAKNAEKFFDKSTAETNPVAETSTAAKARSSVAETSDAAHVKPVGFSHDKPSGIEYRGDDEVALFFAINYELGPISTDENICFYADYNIYYNLKSKTEDVIFDRALFDKIDPAYLYQQFRRFASIDENNQLIWKEYITPEALGENAHAAFTKALKNVKRDNWEHHFDSIVRVLRFLKLIEENQGTADPYVEHAMDILSSWSINIDNLDDTVESLIGLKTLRPEIHRILEDKRLKIKKNMEIENNMKAKKAMKKEAKKTKKIADANQKKRGN